MLVSVMRKTIAFLTILSAAASRPAHQQKQQPNADLGFPDTPILPGLPWHVHDPDRPHPPVVTPASTPGGAPSDAIVLFDGKDLSKWQSHASTISKAGNSGPAEWKVSDG